MEKFNSILQTIQQVKHNICDTIEFSEAERLVERLDRISDTIRQCSAKEDIKPLTMDELQNRTSPVWVQTEGSAGYWCLCHKGIITPPSCIPFIVQGRPYRKFYDHPLTDEEAES